jgi:protein-arginine kinase activator protein McsA
MTDDCQRCHERPAVEPLQRTLGGVPVGHPIAVCESCAPMYAGVDD